MSLDARGMLEVNRNLIFEAARACPEQPPRVVSMATWGRGCKPEALRALQPFNRVGGYNASLVTTPPDAVLQEWLGPKVVAELAAAAPGRFLAIGSALGELTWEWWNLDGTVEPESFV